MEPATTMAVVTSALIGYLLGGIPFGWIVGRLKGVDIRHHGSGNIGATNAARVLGRAWFAPIFTLDFSKGWVSVMLAAKAASAAQDGQLAWSGWNGEGDAALAAGVGACLGHIFPLYLRLRGGKAAATALGVMVGLAPLAAAITLAAFVVVLAASRYVSLASMAGAVMTPIALVLVLGTDTWVAPNLGRFVAITLLAILVLVRHRSNALRLLRGTESRIGGARGGSRAGAKS